MGDSLHHSGPGLDVEMSGGPNGDPPDMGSGVFPRRDDCPDEIPGPHPKGAFLRVRTPLGKPNASRRVRW